MKLNNLYGLLIMICCMAIPNMTHAQEQAPEANSSTENLDTPAEDNNDTKDESAGDGNGGTFSAPIFQDTRRHNPDITAGSPPDPNDIPIDGGVSILLAAGIGYGLKKYRESRMRIDV